MSDWIDLGMGMSMTFYVRHDEPLPAGIIHRCPHGKGTVPFDRGGDYTDRPRWTVDQEDPLTISPSIDCPCGCHGWIREGRWVPA